MEETKQILQSVQVEVYSIRNNLKLTKMQAEDVQLQLSRDI